MDEKGLGQRLQTARVRGGMTQQQLCQQAGLSYSTLTKIERGAIKSPSIFTIQSIAETLGVGLDELLGVTSRAVPKKRRSRSGVSFVYFDINGCLVRFFHAAFAHLAADAAVTVDTVEAAFWHYNDAVCRGEMTMEEFNRNLAKAVGLSSVDWLEYYLRVVEPIPIMDELLPWVAEHYRIGLLTNIMPGFIKALQEKDLLPAVKYDVVIDSSEVGLIKPEEDIFALATKKAGCSPSEILFVDDSRTNLMAAQKLGWRVLWFDDYRPDESVEHVRAALAFAD